MNILDKIIVDKRREVILKKIIPVSQLEALVFSKEDISLSENKKNRYWNYC
jgi:indole-3-glycerol phosphate synthase